MVRPAQGLVPVGWNYNAERQLAVPVPASEVNGLDQKRQHRGDAPASSAGPKFLDKHPVEAPPAPATVPRLRVQMLRRSIALVGGHRPVVQPKRAER